ncbi:MAG: hypothetical protein JNL28_14870 [Planctomycetes bacterium]|nr:hypothetical protein [Planctomycetota bacterium]
MNGRLELLERVSSTRVFVLAFVLLAAWHFESFAEPPYWDALTGAFAQGHWAAQHSLSPFALLREAGYFTRGGACVYPFSIYPTVVALLERLGLEPRAAFVVLHCVSFAAAAVAAAATFALARRALGGVVAALLTAALVLQPMFRALAAQMNMDIVLCAFSLLSVVALVERKHGRAALWAACALLVKPTGIIVVAANLASLVLRLASSNSADPDAAERKCIARSVWAHVALFTLFAAQLAVLAHYDKAPPGVSAFGGTVAFLGKRLWTLPEFGLALFAVLALSPLVVRKLFKREAPGIEIDLFVFTIAFTGFYCQYENVLPRYFLQAWPVVMIAVAVLAARLRMPRAGIYAACVAFAAFGLANAHGRFHPTKYADWSVPNDARPLVSNEGWLLERSLEYQDDLELNRALAERCESIQDAVVVANWPVLQLLAVPRLGYVDRPPQLATAETPIEYAGFEIQIAGHMRPRPAFVRVVTPNVYGSEHSRVLAGDEVLETFERGRLRAFLLRRPSDSREQGR